MLFSLILKTQFKLSSSFTSKPALSIAPLKSPFDILLPKRSSCSSFLYRLSNICFNPYDVWRVLKLFISLTNYKTQVTLLFGDLLIFQILLDYQICSYFILLCPIILIRAQKRHFVHNMHSSCSPLNLTLTRDKVVYCARVHQISETTSYLLMSYFF